MMIWGWQWPDWTEKGVSVAGPPPVPSLALQKGSWVGGHFDKSTDALPSVTDVTPSLDFVVDYYTHLVVCLEAIPDNRLL